jgi:toxin YhaV
MSAGKPEPLVIHGWTVFAHPLFLMQIEALARQVETLKQKDPAGYVKKNASKRLAAITRLAFDVIQQDPARQEYRQGGTLGDDHKHWLRARFFQQYRLFFRYHAPSKVIVRLVIVNFIELIDLLNAPAWGFANDIGSGLEINRWHTDAGKIELI